MVLKGTSVSAVFQHHQTHKHTPVLWKTTINIADVVIYSGINMSRATSFATQGAIYSPCDLLEAKGTRCDPLMHMLR